MVGYFICCEVELMPKLQRVPEAHIEYAYGIYLLNNKHRLIKTLRKRYQPSIHGHKAWGAGFLLMDYLSHNGLVRNAKAMEIGCGWGGVSVFCAHRFKSKVTAVDLDADVFPYVDVLAELNGVKVKPKQADFNKLKGGDLGAQRYILGSDVCFWDSMVKPLARLINRALDNGTKKIIITDPGRPTFYELCDLVSRKHQAKLQEWYASEPDRFEGEVLEIRASK